MTQKDIEWAAAIDILSFMQKHELDDEEMGFSYLLGARSRGQ